MEKLDPKIESILRMIKEQSKTDPLIGAKIGAKEIFLTLMNAMKDDRGIHFDSFLCAVASLSGYSCQVHVRSRALKSGVSEKAVFQIVETANGKKFYFGDALNSALLSSKYSVWSLAAAAAQDAGAKVLPDVNEIAQYTASVIGTSDFGIPRFPENVRSGDTPINYLKNLWAPLFPKVKLFCEDSNHWPVLYGIVLQEAIGFGKAVIDPSAALKISMECAVAMSKVDLDNA